jgi:hypothetical protein
LIRKGVIEKWGIRKLEVGGEESSNRGVGLGRDGMMVGDGEERRQVEKVNVRIFERP